MRKTAATGLDSEPAERRNLPAMERVLASAAFSALAGEFSRERVKEAVAAHLAGLRGARAAWEEEVAVSAVRESLTRSTGSTLLPVINGSGVIIHTNLGRSPIDPALWQRAGETVTGYSNLELDLETGGRGLRDEHLSALCVSVFGCDEAVLTNNNAAGTLLLLAATAAGREVIVSRGELVEIGGAFRVPDVIQQGGARLREVGTTNRTRASDYADAVNRKTAAILRVHRSNFEIVGFTETPSIAELGAVARKKKVPLLYDEGSGRPVDLGRYGFASAPLVRDLFALGVDAVTCSTDKLLGATQGGLILGSAAIIDKVRRHPLMRALRAGKESYDVIAETLRAFATGRYETEVPIYAMLATPMEVLRSRAERLIRGTACEVIESRCALGGGTTPTETIPSVAIALPGVPNEVQARLLRHAPPIIGRIVDDRFTIDLRTLLERDLPAVAAALW
ncbi:MAG: selA [Acidobacteria bacterium]|nr:selA [Acidobacteriota bacterium]